MVRQASICLTQILYSDSLHVWAHSKQFMFGLKDFFYPFFPVLVCAVVGLFGWCLWRFFKKRRPKDAKKNKDGTTDGVSLRLE